MPTMPTELVVRRNVRHDMAGVPRSTVLYSKRAEQLCGLASKERGIAKVLGR